MQPKFKNAIAWEQAQVLMQPAFIRVLDNIRKQLDESTWQGTYEEVQTPYPGYRLCLSHQEQSVKIDIWTLCFQVCFLDYIASPLDENNEASTMSQEVEIDTTLIDEGGEVDWQSLETKTQKLVKDIFTNLPTD